MPTMSTTTKISLGLSAFMFLLGLSGAAPVLLVPSTTLGPPPETTRWLWDCDDDSPTLDLETPTSIDTTKFSSDAAYPQSTAIGPELEGVLPVVSPKNHVNHAGHTLAVTAAIFGGMVAFSALLVVLAKSRFCLGRLSPPDPSEPKKNARRYRDLKKRNLIGAPSHVGIPAWRRFPPLYSPTNVSFAATGSDTKSREETRVIDITAELPKSRFSVTSSDYEDAYESFSPRSSFESIRVEAAKHGRRHSVPATLGHPQSMEGTRGHRRSKSASGWIYDAYVR